MGAAVQNSFISTQISNIQMIVFLIQEVTGLLAFGNIYFKSYSILINFNTRIKWFT